VLDQKTLMSTWKLFMSYRTKTSPVQLYGQDGTILAVPRDQIPIVDGFREPAPLPPRRGDGSSVIVFDLDAHETWLHL
jgi:hypothetical protein